MAIKNLCKKERKRRMFLKRYKSLQNKMHGENLIWWNSLDLKSQYSLLFKWISSKDDKIKHFLYKYKKSYKPNLSNYRESLINHILK